jgi:hypothetical protein
MAGSKTAYLSKKMLDHALGGGAYTPPGTLYLALSISSFTPTATGAAMDEVTVAGYARLPVSNNGTTWTAATAAAPSEKHNINDLAFSAATASWGTPQSAYLCDASTAGNALFGSDITNPQAINVGDTAKISAAAFVFNED